jgi:hypothetical protein
MKAFVIVVVVGLAVVVGGTVAGWCVCWTLAQLGRRYGADDPPLPSPPLPKFGKLTPAEVEQVRLRAERRRQQASARVSEARSIASGDQQSVIHLVGRK